MSNDPALKGHLIASHIHDELLVAYWDKSLHSREYHIAAADRYFSELAAILGYAITKIEQSQVAA
jgi:hypothetical protein